MSKIQNLSRSIQERHNDNDDIADKGKQESQFLSSYYLRQCEQRQDPRIISVAVLQATRAAPGNPSGEAAC